MAQITTKKSSLENPLKHTSYVRTSYTSYNDDISYLEPALKIESGYRQLRLTELLSTTWTNLEHRIRIFQWSSSIHTYSAEGSDGGTE